MRLGKNNLAAVRSKVGMVFQDSDEQLFMPTVLEDVAFGPLNMGMSQLDAILKATCALRDVGMEHALDKAPYHLSAGEKKRVALAGVLAMNPEILILDEPTTYLDPPAQRNLVQSLQKLPQAKLIVTHDVSFAAALATRAVFFEKGKTVANGPIDEIVQRFDWDINYSSAPADAALRYAAQRRF
jgi:cobalt/nickel transport system ATP-binding protein